MADVEQLTAQSDFSRFTAKDVDPQVRNAAMKKLFHSEPQFNVMDGLDVYIDDYNTPDPLPLSIMRTMMQARSLGLLDDELKEQELPTDATAVAALAEPVSAEETKHEDPDLQLQPDDAAGRESADGSAGTLAGGPEPIGDSLEAGQPQRSS